MITRYVLLCYILTVNCFMEIGCRLNLDFCRDSDTLLFAATTRDTYYYPKDFSFYYGINELKLCWAITSWKCSKGRWLFSEIVGQQLPLWLIEGVVTERGITRRLSSKGCKSSRGKTLSTSQSQLIKIPEVRWPPVHCKQCKAIEGVALHGGPCPHGPAPLKLCQLSCLS